MALLFAFSPFPSVANFGPTFFHWGAPLVSLLDVSAVADAFAFCPSSSLLRAETREERGDLCTLAPLEMELCAVRFAPDLINAIH